MRARLADNVSASLERLTYLSAIAKENSAVRQQRQIAHLREYSKDVKTLSAVVETL